VQASLVRLGRRKIDRRVGVGSDYGLWNGQYAVCSIGRENRRAVARRAEKYEEQSRRREECSPELSAVEDALPTVVLEEGGLDMVVEKCETLTPESFNHS
jgi:hypothetical protein